ncbi:MAG: septal ring lytic transglycosylase RlpA family protein [Candidatus Omnitrophica bacterium]|nr:septal ring lytic transglycosylase RlpA family protein [Candidatus Omnitrophota bacterium]
MKKRAGGGIGKRTKTTNFYVVHHRNKTPVGRGENCRVQISTRLTNSRDVLVDALGARKSFRGLPLWSGFIPVILCLVFFVGVGPCKAGEPKTEGIASWYSTKSTLAEGNPGYTTASGESFKDEGLTCAMRSRDFGKYYKVTNLANNKSVIVKHTDFGPNEKLYKKGRIVDLSKGAFAKIADLDEGLVKVKIVLITEGK